MTGFNRIKLKNDYFNKTFKLSNIDEHFKDDIIEFFESFSFSQINNGEKKIH